MMRWVRSSEVYITDARVGLVVCWQKSRGDVDVETASNRRSTEWMAKKTRREAGEVT